MDDPISRYYNFTKCVGREPLQRTQNFSTELEFFSTIGGILLLAGPVLRGATVIVKKSSKMRNIE